jgi:hypothetical protein
LVLVLSRNMDIVGILRFVGGAAVRAGVLETGKMHTLHMVQDVALVGVALADLNITIIPACNLKNLHVLTSVADPDQDPSFIKQK